MGYGIELGALIRNMRASLTHTHIHTPIQLICHRSSPCVVSNKNNNNGIHVGIATHENSIINYHENRNLCVCVLFVISILYAKPYSIAMIHNNNI